MPLTPDEQRILRQIEDQLRNVNPVPFDDPRIPPMRVPYDPKRANQVARRTRRTENVLTAGCGLMLLLYVLGALAFWTGLIYLIWHLALSH